jgi:hypothetical protein
VKYTPSGGQTGTGPADRFMAHAAIQEADDNGQVVTWLDHVRRRVRSLTAT